MKDINLKIRTKPVQFIIMTPFFLPFYWFVLICIFAKDILTIELIVSSVMISFALMMIGLKFLTESETARIEGDKIVFNYRKPIHFSEIESFTFDDGFRLNTRSECWVLKFLCPGKDSQGYVQFLEDFKSTLSEWQERNQETGVDMPRRRYFYGTRKATLTGVVLIVLYVGLLALAIWLGVGYAHVAAITPVFIMVTLLCFFAKKRE